MSSVNWGGNHGSAKCSKKDHIRGVNLLKHCDQTFRADPTKQHSNIEIDPSKSYQNQNFTGMSWKESREKWEKRLAELDRTTNTNKRDDRIEMTSLEMPVPLGMTNEKAKELFQDFYDMCREKFGDENIISATSHFDEIAPYTDAKDGMIKVSRPHIHIQVVPEVNGKLSNKDFSSLTNILKMNQAVEKLCNEKYHVRFNTGETLDFDINIRITDIFRKLITADLQSGRYQDCRLVSGRRCTGSSRCDQHTERSDHRIFIGIIQRICDYYRTEIWCEEHRRYEKVLCNVACDRDWNIHFIYDSRTAIFETDLIFLKCAKASGSGGERIYRDHHSRTACNIFI